LSFGKIGGFDLVIGFIFFGCDLQLFLDFECYEPSNCLVWMAGSSLDVDPSGEDIGLRSLTRKQIIY